MKNNCKRVWRENIEIPKKGVMFLGGHPNLVKKLQQVYPNTAARSATNSPPGS